MPEFDRSHIDISARVDSKHYKAPKRNMEGSAAPRAREEHGAMLRRQLQAAFREVEQQDTPDENFERSNGAYYEVELRPGAKAHTLDRKRTGIYSGATKITDEAGRLTTIIFVPDESVPVLDQILADYAEGELTGKRKKPPNNSYVEPIEAIRRARLFSFWTDKPEALPSDPQVRIWWEVWCRPDKLQEVLAILRRMECRIADEGRWLHFEEAAIVPILARRIDIEVALFACDGILELRRGSDTPNFFLEEERDNQHDWANDLAERTVWPSADAPRVCLLDTGVNRAHILLEPALAETDLLTANPAWVPTDNVGNSHGTEMAGLALHGDLFARLQDESEFTLTHRLESVRIMPADGFPPNEPARLGSITLSAVALAEVQNPERQRNFCLAITNEDHPGDRASTWSACIDRAAIGRTIGDMAGQRRLFVVAAGNVPSVMDVNQLGELADYPIEDPAQAWNALTVGGYTDKIEIDPNDAAFDGYIPHSAAGEVSPFSRNSIAWPQGKSAIKPEILMEAGNRARSANGSVLMDCPSLELLTTGSEADRLPIVNFCATSAATAQAARLAARLQADHPELWPETIRALVVHSADWTEPMWERLIATRSARDRYKLIRLFGYGVPSYERATASALSDVALIAQQTIQPYRRDDNGSIPFNECHYYPLPLPRRVLEQHGDREFRLKVTLSYFVEPNPGKSAAIDPQKYQSFGLRFDLKRPTETVGRFKRRLNANEPDGDYVGVNAQDPNWIIGPMGISAGSLHCDVWRGNGAQLAARDMLCVKPVSGWWKDRKNPSVCEQQSRYALIVTLTDPSEDVDLYTPISVAMETAVEVNVQT